MGFNPQNTNYNHGPHFSAKPPPPNIHMSPLYHYNGGSASNGQGYNHSGQGFNNPPPGFHPGNWGGYNEIVQGKPHHAFGPLKLPKMDFPKFEGKDPRGWVNKCEKFFVLNPYMDSKTKVIFATLHMEGDADIWF